MAVLRFRPSVGSCPFKFPETFKEQPFSVAVASKQSGLFQPCNLVANLGEVAAFGTYLASFPGPAQLSVACSMVKWERAWYLFSRE